ncbi:MAG TPA: pyrroloquinoline quinone-dependent dehydrogenase [Acetobacteraceae bacterium]|jgi:quinoprotein glucose dehydrogenase
MIRLPGLAAAALLVFAGVTGLCQAADTPSQTWYTFNGDLGAQKYATATQITPANVGKLRIAWQLHTGDVSDGTGKIPATVWSATPLFVNHTIYVSTPFYRILAIEPDTGKIKWTFNPHAVLKALTQPDMKTRGVAYWQAPNPQPGQTCQKIVYVGTMDARLYAVDADTGKPCQGFGKNGVVDVDQWNTVHGKYPLSQLQPPTVYKNLLLFGWAGKEWAYEVAPPGIIFALDAQTGSLKWQFHPLTQRMEADTGKVNVWASMSVDTQHDLLYIPTSPPSPDDYGGDRKEQIPYGNAIVALNADTGDVVWSRQLVHHGLWDYDISTAPTLLDIDRNGQKIPALVEPTKQGFIFVLNRLTGEPVFPIEERAVPQSDVPGEQSAPTQPWATTPPPTLNDTWPGVSRIADIASGGYCSRTFSKLRYNGKFTPPALGAGSLIYPPSSGGVEWGGGALDPATNTYVVNSSSVAMIYRLIKRSDYAREAKAAGDPKDFYPMAGGPYGIQIENFVNWLGMPCWKPPFGTISGYDLNTGKLLWRHPFGEVQHWGFYMPKSWGSVTIGGPVITRSGLIFIGASMDSRVRALDLKTGNVLWRAQVEAPAVSIPAVYIYKGREYVLFAVGGNTILMPRVGDQLIAFSLPKGGS